MSRRGNCYDNAAMESFWAALPMRARHWFSLNVTSRTQWLRFSDPPVAAHEVERFPGVGRVACQIVAFLGAGAAVVEIPGAGHFHHAAQPYSCAVGSAKSVTTSACRVPGLPWRTNR